jgi:gamma-glutamylcyclotransferase (GGCT)/AIG2-like uncharacterized protein YtfP
MSATPADLCVHVFVYGTLRRGDRNDINHLNPPPQWLGYGTVRGDLFDYGRHPGLVLRDDGPQVLGEVYLCEPALIKVLDEIELNYPLIPGLYRQAWRSVACGPNTYHCLLYELTDGGKSAQALIKGSGLVDWTSFDLHRRSADGSF